MMEMLMLMVVDEETGQCVSTGNVDDIYKSDNKPLLDFLSDRGFMPAGIQLPAGQWHFHLHTHH